MKSSLPLRAACVLFVALPVFAQWQAVPTLGTPPPRGGFGLAPWPGGGLLLFGGDTANPAATELLFDGVQWTPLTTPVPRRESPMLARNDADGSLLVYGGTTTTGTLLSDTWRYANGAWTQVATPTAPMQKPIAMAFDPASASVLLVTQPLPPAATFATWRFAAGNWTPVNTFSVLAGAPVAMFSDTVRGEAALVVGAVAGLSVQRLVGTTWTAVAQQPGSPTATWGAFDPERGRGVVVRTRLTGWEPYEYDGLSLTAHPAVSLPYVAPGFGALAYHAERREVVLVGATFTALATWRWRAEPQPLATAFAAPCSSPAYTLGLAAGDSPEPGSSHRLRVGGSSAAGLQLSVLGLSHTQNGGLPLPQTIPFGALGCSLRVEALAVTFLGIGLPAQQLVAVPASPTLLGARYDAQFVQWDANGISDASNGLEVQIGLPLPVRTLAESFASDLQRDPVASGDVWANGEAVPVAIGNDGRHGSFDPAQGTLTGPGVYTWSTDNQMIPASATISGQPALVTDGRFFFTDFVVPAGVTVKFVGSAPAQVFVRGRVDVQGIIDGDAADLPFYVPVSGPAAGQRVSPFNARNITTQTMGQAGGAGGPGGGRGGDGGRESTGTGPILVNGIFVTDGQPGQDVRVAAGHAYAGVTAGTGGRGSPMHPAAGTVVSAGPPFITGIAGLAFYDEFSPGGGGGGFLLPGSTATAPTIAGGVTQPNASPIAQGGAAFPLLPFPSNPPNGYSSLVHYLGGGAGGGGGGCHPFGILVLLVDDFMAGHAGSGGGGAMAVRAGGPVAIAGEMRARGGAGVLINGDTPAIASPDVELGVSSPGGGGSGGSVVVQSAQTIVVSGSIDTSGGPGSQTGSISTALAPTQINVQAQAGAGSHGFYRLEAGVGVAFSGAGVPALAAANIGPLADQDDRTGSRSSWYLPPTAALPMWLRYEIVAQVGAQTVLFSDDPSVSTLAANDPNGAVFVRFQGARLDPLTGNVNPATIGPWRDTLQPGAGSLNSDRGSVLRFDLVQNKALGAVRVLEVRMLWR